MWDAILEVWRSKRGPELVKAPSRWHRRKCGVTCEVSYDVDLVEQCTVKAVSSDLEKCKHVDELWMPQSLLPEGVGPEIVRGFEGP